MANPYAYGQIKTKHPPKGSGEAETHFELLGRPLVDGCRIYVKTKDGDVEAVFDGKRGVLLMDGSLSYQGERVSVPVWKDEVGATPEAGGWCVVLPGLSKMGCRWP